MGTQFQRRKSRSTNPSRSYEENGRKKRGNFGLADRSPEGWIFPSERVVTPLFPDNVLRRDVYPRLEPLGLDWINFRVLRRSHSTLHQDKGTDPKIIADQQGHGLGVHLSDYVQSSIARKQEAVTALWSDFVAIRSATVEGDRDK